MLGIRAFHGEKQIPAFGRGVTESTASRVLRIFPILTLRVRGGAVVEQVELKAATK